jgi:hypothetical protein
MAQHDYVIANQSGAAFRSDLNNGLSAIVSQNSGSAEPSTTYAYMWWADTTTGLLKIRNAANNAWVTVGTLATTNLGLAPLASPTFTGTVTAPTFTASTGVNIPLGSAGSPSLYFTGDTNTGLFSPGADTVALATAGSNRLHITSAGLVGIGTSVVNSLFEARGTSDGQNILHLSNNAGASDGGATNVIRFTCNGNTNWANARYDAYVHSWNVNSSEAMRIDSSKRLLVGTSSARTIEPYGLGADGQTANVFESLSDTNPGPGIALCSNSATARMGPYLYFCRSGAASLNSNTVVASGDNLGTISFAGADGTDVRTRGAAIYCEVDGTPGADDMPGRLVFSTTADGAASPTERFRISSTGAQSSVIPGGSTIYPQFGCRAWVNFDGTGTYSPNPSTSKIRGSGNVSSITDNGTGDYTVNFTTAMADANYATNITIGTFTDSGAYGYATFFSSATYTSSSVRFITRNASNNASIDSLITSVAIFR